MITINCRTDPEPDLQEVEYEPEELEADWDELEEAMIQEWIRQWLEAGGQP